MKKGPFALCRSICQYVDLQPVIAAFDLGQAVRF
jgi:hypothetical protein